MTDAFQQAERRGYSKGYRAGLVRKQRQIKDEQRSHRRAQFWNRAFLAALPACIEAEGWTIGEKKINSSEDRVMLAARIADKALERYREFA